MPQLTPYLQNGIEIFKQYYTSLDDPNFLNDERHYKVEASFMAQDSLSRTTMDTLLRQGRAEELLKSIKTIFRSKTNLPSPQEKTVIGNISTGQAEEFSRALYNFLYGETSWNERLAQFANLFHTITGQKASWPQLTLFPFLVFPQKHIFLKPEAMIKAAQVLGYGWDYKPSPDLNTYLQFQKLAHHLVRALHSLGARDMIDVQSFLWVIAGAAHNYWRIVPGKGAQYWPQFQQFERIAAGWDDIGPLTQYTSQTAIKDALIVKGGKSSSSLTVIARELDDWRRIKKGDTIFIYGHNSILGMGEIAGDYEYIPGEWPPGSRDEENIHHYKVRWLTLAQKKIDSLPDPLQKKLQIPQTILSLTLDEARILLEFGGIPPVNNRPISDLNEYIMAHGFHFPRELLTTYYLSLQTKPFVILTGISGTGKTKLTQLFADWMSPAIEEETVETAIPTDRDDVFYLEVKPYYFQSGFVLPVKVYQYFNLPEVGHTVSVNIQLGHDGPLTEAKYRHQRHTKGNSFVYFFNNDAIREWLKTNFKIGDFLAFRANGEQKYRLEKFQPIKKQLVKQKPHHVFLSVKPDWTDNRGLLGFYNLITQTYQTTDFMRLLTQATIEPEAPYFIILDEMNLAKVEYYFADFLSVLESRYVKDGKIKQEMLRLHDLPRCVLAQGETPWDDEAELAEDGGTLCPVRCEGCPLRYGVDETHWSPSWAGTSYTEAKQAGFKPERYVPPRLLVPINTYFTGTVNVDETTYMFSPKVLDRANTIEFNQVNLTDYFAASRGAADGSSATDIIRQQFTHSGQFIQLPKHVPNLRTDPTLMPYRQRLTVLNEMLAPYTMHFGYRVADEILLYLWQAHQLKSSDFNLDTAFDYQIYQKVLPKLHGSEAKLKEPLGKLQDFCQLHNCPRSLAKIERMLSQLMKEGFASFA